MRPCEMLLVGIMLIIPVAQIIAQPEKDAPTSGEAVVLLRKAADGLLSEVDKMDEVYTAARHLNPSQAVVFFNEMEARLKGRTKITADEEIVLDAVFGRLAENSELLAEEALKVVPPLAVWTEGLESY